MEKKPLCGSDKDLLLKYGLEKSDYTNALRLSFARGEYLSREGEALNYIYFVVSGKAKVLLSLSNGKQLLLAYFISKGIIGDIELMTDVQTHQATLQAVTDFVCVALPINEYKTMLKNNNVFINHVGKELAEKLLQRAVNGAINTLQPLEARLCAYICQTSANNIFNEQLTEVAIIVGTSYRHLLRCLNKLCDNQILEKQPKAYRITDHRALRAMAGDLYVLEQQ